LFHYAHFLGEAVFNDVVMKVYENNTVYRLKEITNTLGYFKPMYEHILKVKCVEVSKAEFDKMNVPLVTGIVPYTPNTIAEFRSYMFKRFPPQEPKYSKYVLIERGGQRDLVADTSISNGAKSTGKTRREIHNINVVHTGMKQKYPTMVRLELEDLSIEDQINLFSNAEVIVCAHGAAMTNMLFCKPHTKLFEITCGSTYHPFNTFSKILELRHVRIHKNTPVDVLRVIYNN
jgi:hypothetical protein